MDEKNILLSPFNNQDDVSDVGDLHLGDDDVDDEPENEPVVEPESEETFKFDEEAITLTIENINNEALRQQEVLRQQQLRQQMLPPRRRVDPRFRLFYFF